MLVTCKYISLDLKEKSFEPQPPGSAAYPVHPRPRDQHTPYTHPESTLHPEPDCARLACGNRSWAPGADGRKAFDPAVDSLRGQGAQPARAVSGCCKRSVLCALRPVLGLKALGTRCWFSIRTWIQAHPTVCNLPRVS